MNPIYSVALIPLAGINILVIVFIVRAILKKKK